MTHLEEYNRIIEFRKANPLPKDQYGEKHHIKPKSIYPELVNDKDNIVRLSAQEHFLAHYHLWLAYRDELKEKTWAKKMCLAFNRMKHQLMKCDDIEMMSQLYTEARKDLSEACKGRKLSEKTRKKMSESHKGKHHFEETRKKMSEANKGKHRSEETCRKISESHKGRHHTQETKQKISVAMQGMNNPMYGKPCYFNMDETKKADWCRKCSRPGKMNGRYGKPTSDKTKELISKASKGRHWYTNGIQNIFIHDIQCPEGFWAGRLTRKSKKECK